VAIKKRAVKSKTRATTANNTAAVTNTAQENEDYRNKELNVVGSYQFKPLFDDEYTALSNEFRPQMLQKIATYKICKVIKAPFQTKVSKGEIIKISRHLQIKSTVAKNRWVVLVAWAEVFGTNLKDRKKLEFKIDNENVHLVECGDTVDWELGKTEDPIRVRKMKVYNRNVELFKLEQSSHEMLQTLDGSE